MVTGPWSAVLGGRLVLDGRLMAGHVAASRSVTVGAVSDWRTEIILDRVLPVTGCVTSDVVRAPDVVREGTGDGFGGDDVLDVAGVCRNPDPRQVDPRMPGRRAVDRRFPMLLLVRGQPALAVEVRHVKPPVARLPGWDPGEVVIPSVRDRPRHRHLEVPGRSPAQRSSPRARCGSWESPPASNDPVRLQPPGRGSGGQPQSGAVLGGGGLGQHRGDLIQMNQLVVHYGQLTLGEL